MFWFKLRNVCHVCFWTMITKLLCTQLHIDSALCNVDKFRYKNWSEFHIVTETSDSIPVYDISLHFFSLIFD